MIEEPDMSKNAAEQKNLFDFAKAHAPCYVYEEDAIIKQCKELQSRMPQVHFLYSLKTNPFPEVVKTIATQGFGADAASAGEVFLAEKTGIHCDKIFYSAPGKTAEDISAAWGKCTFIADSFCELERLEQKAAEENTELQVGVRIHPKFSMHGNEAETSKFGIDEDLFLHTAWEFPHLRVKGIHIHLQSQILDAECLSVYYRKCYELAERVHTLPGVDIRFINFGSGIGTVYDAESERELDLEKLGETMKDLAFRNQKALKAQLYVETGRFVVCRAGTYFTPIVDKKVSCGKTYLIVKNAMNGFFRPTIAELLKQNTAAFPKVGQEPLYTSANQCQFRVLGKSERLETVDIAGNLCTALDVLAKDIVLPKAEIGDIIAVSNAGSYGYSLSPQAFSGQEAPGQYLIK